MRIYCSAEQHGLGGPGSFYLARSEQLLPSLLKQYRGKVQLIYLDPPFGTGDAFLAKGGEGGLQFRDDMPEEEYIKWMRTILQGCHQLLSSTGSLYLHIDWRMSAKLRLLLDDIFSQDNFMDEIIWGYKARHHTLLPQKPPGVFQHRRRGQAPGSSAPEPLETVCGPNRSGGLLHSLRRKAVHLL